MKDPLTHPVFKVISDAAAARGIEAFVIGGFVRDHFLNRECKDIDIVTAGDGIELAAEVAARMTNTKVSVFKNFGTAMLKWEDLHIEFVGARKESYRSNSRKPDVESGTLENDQDRRDFTINTMAWSLQRTNYGKLIDPFNGMEDLQNRIIRTPLDPGITYSDDPLRMMRAIRFATQLDFSIHPESLQAISQQKDRIRIISMERVSDELNKIILSPVPSTGFKLLFDTGLLHLIFPQMAALHGVEVINGKGHKDNFYHTLQVLDNISIYTGDLWLRWAAILHDIAKPPTKRFEPDHGWTFHGHEDKGARMVPAIFKHLKLPLNEKMKFVQKMVQLHLRPIVLAQSQVTDSAVRRLLFDAGDDIDSLMILCQADITSKNSVKVKKYTANFELVKQKLVELEEKDRIRNWQPPVSGEDIMSTFNLKPGREIGLLKNAIREAILEGEIGNNYDEAFRYMLEKGKDMGLKAEGEANAG